MTNRRDTECDHRALNGARTDVDRPDSARTEEPQASESPPEQAGLEQTRFEPARSDEAGFDQAGLDQPGWDEPGWDEIEPDDTELDDELDDAELDEVAEQEFERLAALIARIDPVPEHVVAAARAALSLRALDAELATLISDSAAEPVTAAVRGEPLTALGAKPDIRLLSFEASGARLDVEVTGLGGGFRIVGQIAGTEADSAVVEDGSSAHELPVDESGRFRVDGLTGGRVRLRFLTADGATVATTWISL